MGIPDVTREYSHVPAATRENPWDFPLATSEARFPCIACRAIAFSKRNIVCSQRLWMYFCLVGKVVCVVESTYMWIHMVFVFLFLTYFTSHYDLSVHPRCYKWHCFLLFSGCQLFYYVAHAYHIFFIDSSASIHQTTLTLSPCLSYR